MALNCSQDSAKLLNHLPCWEHLLCARGCVTSSPWYSNESKQPLPSGSPSGGSSTLSLCTAKIRCLSPGPKEGLWVPLWASRTGDTAKNSFPCLSGGPSLSRGGTGGQGWGDGRTEHLEVTRASSSEPWTQPKACSTFPAGQ